MAPDTLVPAKSSQVVWPLTSTPLSKPGLQTENGGGLPGRGLQYPGEIDLLSYVLSPHLILDLSAPDQPSECSLVQVALKQALFCLHQEFFNSDENRLLVNDGLRCWTGCRSPPEHYFGPTLHGRTVSPALMNNKRQVVPISTWNTAPA